MSFFLRQTVRSLVLMGVLVTLGAAAPRADKVPAPSPAEAEMARMPEVRLRKLHLVRPDLIPYPIAYEICC